MTTYRYTGPISITQTTTLKFIAVVDGVASEVQSEVYTIDTIVTVLGKSSTPHKGNVSVSASRSPVVSVVGKAASVSKGSVSVTVTKNPTLTVTGKFASAYKGNVLSYGTISGDVVCAVSGIDVHPLKGIVEVVGGKSVTFAVHGKVGTPLKGFVNVSINDMQTASGNIRAGDSSLIVVIDYQGNRIQILYT